MSKLLEKQIIFHHKSGNFTGIQTNVNQ